jgi:hypothetical protein
MIAADAAACVKSAWGPAAKAIDLVIHRLASFSPSLYDERSRVEFPASTGHAKPVTCRAALLYSESGVSVNRLLRQTAQPEHPL